MVSKLFRNIFTRSTNFYQNCLNRHPIKVQAVQVSLLMGLGDVLAQTVVEKNDLRSLNLRRTGEFAGLGLFLVGPTLRYWYGTLDRVVRTQQPLKRTLHKVCLDQLVFAPIFLATFTSTISLVQGLDKNQVFQRLKSDYKDILLTNYCLWPPVQVVNFYLIPLNYQVIVVQIVALIWNIYISWKVGNKENSLVEENFALTK